jgi:hypothetical protein
MLDMFPSGIGLPLACAHLAMECELLLEVGVQTAAATQLQTRIRALVESLSRQHAANRRRQAHPRLVLRASSFRPRV